MNKPSRKPTVGANRAVRARSPSRPRRAPTPPRVYLIDEMVLVELVWHRVVNPIRPHDEIIARIRDDRDTLARMVAGVRRVGVLVDTYQTRGKAGDNEVRDLHRQHDELWKQLGPLSMAVVVAWSHGRITGAAMDALLAQPYEDH